MSDGLYQHFRPEETDFIAQMQEQLFRVSDQQIPYLTEFLNPRQVFIVQSLVGKGEGIHCHCSSHYFPMEMQRLYICPDYYEVAWTDFGISLLAIAFPSRFVELRHRQILGTLLNQLGLKRTTFGDIRVTSEACQVFVKENLADFFQKEVTQIGRHPVRLSLIPAELALPEQDDYRPKMVLVSSPRLDKFIAAGFNISRQVANQLISQKKVTVNFALTEKTAMQLGENDRVSVRGFGRLKIGPFLGESRSGKMKLQVGIIKHK
ncbi:YlmH family RNA-binding protein [Streptococcus sp. DD12]|uniref:YlmH family RNA-binding protein n=1 Tax=Streptococcus sp. DD12 TaxID=1777880 RepID=UPI00079C2454|nr:YlmH/Sll1252 family protein [Streptococcus sp. DD12]KXT75753.1 hypothetical protein STRDD12_00865 [Streptococcus sp. DD12]